MALATTMPVTASLPAGSAPTGRATTRGAGAPERHRPTGPQGHRTIGEGT
ncbi:hypothetical protein OOK31_05500 [Streptomyces sp. NBC_00249]|nr:hypothetical protein [Streptomyces sp. NBC_00249]MCX5193347.1 hypothetical protein [Streptomyces sp. NBC_00249]